MFTTRGDATERAPLLILESEHTSGGHSRAPQRDSESRRPLHGGSLVLQPGLGVRDLAEDLGRRKATGREDLEDLRCAEPRVRPDDDGTGPEPDAVTKPANLLGHGSELLVRRQRGRVAQVQDDIHPSRALLVHLQLAKMSDHLRECDLPKTTGADETERFIDRVCDRHSSPLSRLKDHDDPLPRLCCKLPSRMRAAVASMRTRLMKSIRSGESSRGLNVRILAGNLRDRAGGGRIELEKKAPSSGAVGVLRPDVRPALGLAGPAVGRKSRLVREEKGGADAPPSAKRYILPLAA